MKPVPDQNLEKLVCKRTAASLLGVSFRSVERLVNLHRLTKVKILGAVRFRVSEINLLMQGGKA
jgi:hypothetical protein